MFFRALLVIEANKHLQNGCKKKVAVQAPSDENSQPPPPPSVNVDGSTPGTPPINPTGTDSNTIGGLIITGSTKVVTGQKVTYKACDANGIPYTSGSFSWGHSDNSMMILDNKSGNSVIGVFNKVGTILLWVHYDDGTGYKAKAYLDIKITEAKDNLVSTSEQEKLDRHCNAITGQLQSARERGDINEYRSLLSSYKQCDFYDQALNFLSQMENALQQGDHSTQSEPPNKCGRIIPKEELTGLREAYKIKAKSWSHAAAVDYMYGPSGWIHHLSVYLANDKYEKNVENWKKTVNCVDACVSAYPKKNKSNQDYHQFIDCVKKCKLERCKP
jgi:hypothetical protein